MSEARHALSSLRVRRLFLAAAKAQKQVRRGMVVQARARDKDEPSSTPVRFGLTASKKIGNAVARARRRLRAAAQEILPLEGRAGFDYVMIGRVHTAPRPWQMLKNDLRSALKALHNDTPEPTDSAKPNGPNEDE
ncbi:ribonuclease P protein component [Alphaproteobacteria bacterium]|nr:ribonuclease P protein component [Alphaproteobacteria bacterium]